MSKILGVLIFCLIAMGCPSDALAPDEAAKTTDLEEGAHQPDAGDVDGSGDGPTQDAGAADDTTADAGAADGSGDDTTADAGTADGTGQETTADGGGLPMVRARASHKMQVRPMVQAMTPRSTPGPPMAALSMGVVKTLRVPKIVMIIWSPSFMGTVQ